MGRQTKKNLQNFKFKFQQKKNIVCTHTNEKFTKFNRVKCNY